MPATTAPTATARAAASGARALRLARRDGHRRGGREAALPLLGARHGAPPARPVRLTVEQLLPLDGFQQRSAENVIALDRRVALALVSRVVFGARHPARRLGDGRGAGAPLPHDGRAAPGGGLRRWRPSRASARSWPTPSPPGSATPSTSAGRRPRSGRRQDGAPPEEAGPADGPLTGYTLSLTGTLEGYSRDAAEAAIVERGGKVTELRLEEDVVTWSPGRARARSSARGGDGSACPCSTRTALRRGRSS